MEAANDGLSCSSAADAGVSFNCRHDPSARCKADDDVEAEAEAEADREALSPGPEKETSEAIASNNNGSISGESTRCTK